MRERTEYSYGESGIFCGERINRLSSRDIDFFLLPFSTTEKPNPPKGKIAIINPDKTTWNYVDDKSGSWYHKETKEILILTEKDFEKDVSEYTKAVPEGDWRILIYNPKNDCWIESEEKEKELLKEIQKEKILLKLSEIDGKSIRAYRGYVVSKNNMDLKKLEEYEEEAEKLRAELKELEK